MIKHKPNSKVCSVPCVCFIYLFIFIYMSCFNRVAPSVGKHCFVVEVLRTIYNNKKKKKHLTFMINYRALLSYKPLA